MKSLPFGVLMLLSLLVSAAVSFGITPIVKRVAYKVGAVDVPKDERRMHSVPIPRLGGLAIAIAFLLTVVLFAQVGEQMQGILLGAVVILVLGVLDDCLTLRAWFKFLVQIFAAYLVTSHGCTIRYFTNPIVTSSVQYLDLGRWSVPITIVWIVAITNAVNFIDGLDGLAVGVSAISAATLLVIALLVAENNLPLWLRPFWEPVWASCRIISTRLKYLWEIQAPHSWDILATLSIQGMFKLYAIISFAVPFLILGIPIFDICFAIIRRLAKHQNPMKADRGHIHHRLIDMGFSQKQAVAITYMLTAMLGLAAVVLTSSGEGRALILIGAVFVVGAIGFGMIFNRNQQRVRELPEEKDEETKERVESK